MSRHRPGSTPKALLAGFASSVIPGLGQVAAGARRRGWFLLAVTALAAVTAALVAANPMLAVELVAAPWFLAGLLAIDLVFLGFRAVAAWDAFRLVRRGSAGLGAGVVLAGLLAFTALPHLAVGYYGWVLDRTLTQVLVPSAPDPVAAPARSTTTSTTASPTTTSSTTTASTSTSTTLPPNTSTTTASVDEPDAADAPDIPPPFWSGMERLNVLLVGTDAGPGRAGARTDSMMLASIDPASGRAALFGIPRNLRRVPVPEPLASRFPCDCWEGLLNALYRYGQANPELYPDAPDPGLAALRAAVQELVGVPIHHHVMVDMAGFVEAIDAVGGVEVDVRRTIEVELSPPSDRHEWRTYRLEPGRQRLDGIHALAYVRSRSDSHDYDRMARQRCVLASLADQVTVTGMLPRLPAVADVVSTRVQTDIPRDALPDLVRLAGGIDLGSVVTIGFDPIELSDQQLDFGRGVVDTELVRQVVADVFDTPPGEASTPLAGDAC